MSDTDAENRLLVEFCGLVIHEYVDGPSGLHVVRLDPDPALPSHFYKFPLGPLSRWDFYTGDQMLLLLEAMAKQARAVEIGIYDNGTTFCRVLFNKRTHEGRCQTIQASVRAVALMVVMGGE